MPQLVTVPEVLLNRADVEKQARISRSSIYRNIKKGIFPKPVNLGSGAVRWKQSDITAWIGGLTSKAEG
ncbi:MAG: AlpA family phage regulatory protein [Sulfuriferula sp.]|nr:AlpA family phage regulatory protein [Sulfuriferula sp.]NOT18207.1 AlpA family phage regulatory protein [Sulfuriferula sp.]